MRELSPAQRGMDGHAWRRAGAIRDHGRDRSDLSDQRRFEFPQRRHFDARGSPFRVQHVAQQGVDPRRHRDSAECRVRSRFGRRSLRLCQCRRAISVPAPFADDQPQVPEHGHVGRPRDVQGSGIARLHSWDDELFRLDPLRPRRSIERCDHGSLAGRDATYRGTARSDRRIRNHALHRAGLRP